MQTPLSSEKSRTLVSAQFDPRLKSYVLYLTSLIMIATLFGILILPFWIIFGGIYVRRYFQALSCELTTRSLNFKKGVLFTTERTVPLDKIQDLSFKEGPLLRFLGLSTLKIETAGQGSSNDGSEMALTGIIDAQQFRQQVLSQRDMVTELHAVREDHAGSSLTPESIKPVLTDIRDTLRSIEAKLSSSR